MLRRSQAFLRVSPFALYLQDMQKAGKLKKKDTIKMAAKSYRGLPEKEKRALVKRAGAMSYPLQSAYTQMVRREAPRLKSMTTKARQSEIAKKWAALKKTKKSATKAAGSAKRKIKAASKAAKSSKK